MALTDYLQTGFTPTSPNMGVKTTTPSIKPTVPTGQMSQDQMMQKFSFPTNITGSLNIPIPKTSTGAPALFGSKAPTATFARPNVIQTPTGSYASADTFGNVAQSNFNLNTSNPKSSVLGNAPTMNDVSRQYNQYQTYLQQLAQANQYSPEYANAYQAVQNADLNRSAIANNINNPEALPGATMGDLQTTINRAQTANTLTGATANIALQTQALIRQGNIAGAKALVEAYQPVNVAPGSALVSPVTGQEQYSGLGGYQAVQGIQTVMNLAQNFPDANIQPTDSLPVAQQKAQNAPSFTSKNLVSVPLPGGGYSFVNKNQVITNPDGTYTMITPEQATQVNSASAAIKSLVTQKSDVQRAISTADTNFPLLLNAAQAAGVNNNSPLINELQQKLGAKWSTSPALAALNTLIPSLQTEYAQIVSRGGTVTNETRDSAQAIVNGTYSLNQLKSVYETLQAESENVLNGYDEAINTQTQNLSMIKQTTPQMTSQIIPNAPVNDEWAKLLQ